MQPLIDSLFSLLITTPERGLLPLVRREIAESGPDAWQHALTALAPH